MIRKTVSERDCDRLDLAVEAAAPTLPEGRSTYDRRVVTFDVEKDGWVYRVLVQARQLGLTREAVTARREM